MRDTGAGHQRLAKPDDELARRASELYATGRLHEARRAYEQLVARDPLDPAACLHLGWLYSFAGQPKAAEDWMRKALTLSGTAEASYGLALVLLREQRFDEAMALCEAGAKQTPDDSRVIFCLGQSYLARGRSQEAETCFRRVAELDGDQPAAWMRLGASLRLQDRHAEALEACERAATVAARSGQT